MSSLFFRRPGEDSSDTSSDEDTEELEHSQQSAPSFAGSEIELTKTESLSTDASFVNPHQNHAPEVQSRSDFNKHRDLMFATLLEEFCKTRAAELINTGNPGSSYDRLSIEIQPLARKLYEEASQALTSNGFLPSSVTSSSSSNDRKLYLSGLDKVSVKTVEDHDLTPARDTRRLEDVDSLALVKAGRRRSTELIKVFEPPIGSILMDTGRMRLSSPQSDMQMTFGGAHKSHYQSSFQQMKMLGKGGFGRVYHAYNIFDKKEYAVKKIPLSPKLSERYRQSGHQELESVLREVQALAQLEHRNCVRYHACWVEEPQSPFNPPPSSKFPRPSTIQRLLTNRVHMSDESSNPTPKSRPRSNKIEKSDGIVFGFDSSPQHSSSNANRLAEERSVASVPNDASSTPARESELFTDGNALPGSNQTDNSIDHSVYVLHVQMSLYPLTLTQYLAPPPANSLSAPSSPPKRHCFHIIPSLRILLGIICGLQYIHAKGLIHRDIKPGNIFLSTLSADDRDVNRLAHSEGFVDVGSCPSCPNAGSYHVNPRIGDFGLVAELVRNADGISSSSSSSSSSSHVNAHLDGSGVRQVGTEFYRPPHRHDPPTTNANHQNGTLNIDEKLDVYALGVILVEMLCFFSTTSERVHVLRDLQRGRIPPGLAASIDAEMAALATNKEQAALGSSVRWRVEECISGMIEREPGERWGCEKVKEGLETILDSCCPDRKELQWEGRTEKGTGRDRRRVRTLSGSDSEG